MTKLIALDPSLSCIGFCVFDTSTDTITRHGSYKPTGPDLDAKLSNAHHWLRALLLELSPLNAFAIETPIMSRNAATTIKLAYLGGVLRLAAWPYVDRIIPILPQTRLSALALPVRMKRQSAKTAVLRIVNQLYPELNLGPKDHDIADSVAIALAAVRKMRREETTT